MDNIRNGAVIFNVGTGSTTSDYTTTSMYDTPSGMRADVKSGRKAGKMISPKVYFRYLKSKLTKTDKTNLKKRLDILQTMINSAKENEQQALYETLTYKLVSVLLESEAEVVGCDTYISKNTIEKYKDHVRDDDCKVVLDQLEDFPRILPPNVQSTLRALKEKKVFNEYYVLHLSYKNGEKIKTNKEKIREKDPILFGMFEEDSERFYFIADWVDEYCDLTLDKLVDEMHTEDFDPVHVVPEMNEDYLDDLKREVRARIQRLKNTGMDNYKELMRVEDQINKRSVFKDIVNYYKHNSIVVKSIRKFFYYAFIIG